MIQKTVSYTREIPEQLPATLCRWCNQLVGGRFCTGCGASARELPCATCGVITPAGARYCPDCGTGATSRARTTPLTERRADRLPRLVGVAAVLVLAAFLAGMVSGRRLPATTASAASGDVARARAEADSILAARPNHLLGLVLAIRAADLRRDSTAAVTLRRRLLAAAPSDRTSLKQYGEHSRDIDDALTKAAATTR